MFLRVKNTWDHVVAVVWVGVCLVLAGRLFGCCTRGVDVDGFVQLAPD